jgi:hypothetical protein
MSDLDLREQLTRIDSALAEHRRIDAEIENRLVERRRIDAEIDRNAAERDRRRQEIKYQPWIAIIGGVTAAAALMAAGAGIFAAGGAFLKAMG